MASVNAVLGIEQEPNRKKRLRKAEYESNKATKDKVGLRSEDTRRVDGVTRDGTGPERNIIGRPGALHEATNADEDEDKILSKDKGDEEEESELDYDKYASRLANSSDPESSEDDDENVFESTLPTGAQRVARELSLSLSPSPSDRTQSPSPPPSKAKSAKPNTTAPKSTTFLPSLMMGGYWSGSESASEIDEEADAAGIKLRKNRMGQQARRALWEKKFGSKANHIKNQPREADWDARKGARGGDERGKRGRGRGGRRDGGGRREFGGSGNGPSGANTEKVGGRKAKVEERLLHPSWEAAKKAKEQKQMATFQGKKVVFD